MRTIARHAVILFALVALSGCAHEAADNATVLAQASLSGYQTNMVAGWEGELNERLRIDKERIDKFVDVAFAEATKPDGTIDAKVANAIHARKATLYTEMFAEEVRVRRAIADAQEDAANAAMLLGGLRESFQKRAQASEIAAQASESALKMLEKILARKTNP